jgi:levanase/fructan beta-fructosidase
MAANGKYLVGEFDGRDFKPSGGFDAITSDYSREFYAGQTFDNMPDGRRVQIAWLRDGQFPGMPFNQQLTFPTMLTLHRTSDGLRLRRMPVKEIELLRDQKQAKLDELSGDLLDINVVIEPGNAKRVGLIVRGESITYDVASKEVICGSNRAPLEMIDGRIALRVLVDRASIEIFANEGVVSISRNYTTPNAPAPAPASAPTFVAEGGEARLISCEGYTLKSAWKK